MNKGDVILLFIFVATAVFFGSNFYLIIHDFQQWDMGFITAFTAIFGGEILAFAAYRSFKMKYKSKFDNLEPLEDEGNNNEGNSPEKTDKP